MARRVKSAQKQKMETKKGVEDEEKTNHLLSGNEEECEGAYEHENEHENEYEEEEVQKQ